MNVLSAIRTHVLNRSIIFSSHARERMFERNISSEDILPILTDGEIIEEYGDDMPCPSILILGFIHELAIHVVVACCEDHIKIVTVYHPDQRWTQKRFRSEKK